MKSIFKIYYLLLLLLICNNSYGQKNNLDRVAVTKNVRLLDSAKFAYIVHEKGSDFLTFICKGDMNDFKGFLFITYDDAIIKDSKVKDIPFVPEGSYLVWNDKKKIWELKKGTLKDVLKMSSK